MTSPITQFQENIDQVKILGGIFSSIDNNTTPRLDSSDILRAEIVMAISALDAFIHGLVEEKMLLIYQGKRPQTKGYKNFQIPLSKITNVLSDSSDTTWLRDLIQIHTRYISYQTASKISSALILISDKPIWPEVANNLNMSESSIIKELNQIVQRRNQIVHQTDSIPECPNTRWPIDKQSVNDAICHIENICNSISRIIG